MQDVDPSAREVESEIHSEWPSPCCIQPDTLMAKCSEPWKSRVGPRHNATIDVIKVQGRHLDLSVDGEPSATIPESVPEFDDDGVLAVGKCEPVSGRVVRIRIAKVSPVSSGTQGVAGLPQQHQLDRGVRPIFTHARAQIGAVGMRNIYRLQLGLGEILLDGLGRQGEEIRPAQ